MYVRWSGFWEVVLGLGLALSLGGCQGSDGAAGAGVGVARMAITNVPADVVLIAAGCQTYDGT